MGFVLFVAQIVGYLCLFISVPLFVVCSSFSPRDQSMLISKIRLSKAATAIMFASMTLLSFYSFFGGNPGVGFLFFLLAVANVFSYLSDRKKLKEAYAKLEKLQTIVCCCCGKNKEEK